VKLSERIHGVVSGWVQRRRLFAPPHRKRPHQHGERPFHRLSPVENRLNNVRHQQRQPQHSPDLGLIDLLSGGNLRDDGVRAVLQHFAPSERPGNRLDHGVVDLSGGHRPCIGCAVRCEDEATARCAPVGPKIRPFSSAGVCARVFAAHFRGLPRRSVCTRSHRARSIMSSCPQVQSNICRPWRKFARLLAQPRRSCAPERKRGA